MERGVKGGREGEMSFFCSLFFLTVNKERQIKSEPEDIESESAHKNEELWEVCAPVSPLQPPTTSWARSDPPPTVYARPSLTVCEQVFSPEVLGNAVPPR